MYDYVLVTDSGKTEFNFVTKSDVFYPTDTSKLLIEAGCLSISSPKKILDLGCGCGVTGITLAKLGLSKGCLYASDISTEAVVLANKNAKKMGIEYAARQGSLFNPWLGEKFDVIIDDVAGISDDIARISPWYSKGVECNAGQDGTRWVIQVIEQASLYLNKGGMLIFPVLSLSKERKIIKTLENSFSSFEMVIKKDWFLPSEIENNIEVLTSLINDGSINCFKKFGRWIWSTSIYRAIN